jgi:hypothetical protein
MDQAKQFPASQPEPTEAPPPGSPSFHSLIVKGWDSTHSATSTSL